MLKLLAIAQFIPLPDRHAGMLRFFRMIEILSTRYQVSFFASEITDQLHRYGILAIADHEAHLRDRGIGIHYGSQTVLNRLLHQDKFDIVVFEYYQLATQYLDDIRYLQPQARAVIDTIDISFERLLSKARSSGKSEDFQIAAKEKKAELSAYQRSDLVIAISDQEKQSLAREDDSLAVDVIPLIMPLPQLGPPRDGSSCNLLFVGNFDHAPNVDAITFFCTRIFPDVKKAIPCATLTIVGASPRKSVLDLASDDVRVLGFVQDLKPYYEGSDIAIAPLTWGAGLKGKVAEAMCYGLPVVATTVGIDGFGLSPGENVILGDTPMDFTDGLVTLYKDRALYERVRTNARKFVETNYTGKRIEERVNAVFDRVERLPPKGLSLPKRLKLSFPDLLDRHLLWRFRRNA